jgi:hypothetical protein
MALPSALRDALAQAVDGDPDAINRQLFDASGTNSIYAWLARVRGGRYVWMIGEIDPIEQQIRAIRDKVLAGQGLALTLDTKPPPARFVSVHASSIWQKAASSRVADGSETFAQDMAIFQTTYLGDTPRNDIDQQFCINASLLDANTKAAYRLALEQLAGAEQWYPALNQLSRLLAMLHVELHNLGHFCGPFPFRQDTKGRLAYQPIEEFRACLAAIQLLSEADVDAHLKRAFLQHVIIVRCFLYAFRAFHSTQKDSALVRECIVGAMFAERFLEFSQERLAFFAVSAAEYLNEIHELEAKVQLGTIDLGEVAKELLARTFPDGRMAAISSLIYSSIRS